MSIFDGFTIKDLEDISVENTSYRGFNQGYLAEKALKKQLLQIPGISKVIKIPDQSKERGDLKVTYFGKDFTIEVKSVETRSIRQDVLNDTWQGCVKIGNTNKKKKIIVEGLGPVFSNALTKGAYDILAISCYAATGDWNFLFIPNSFLPERMMEIPGLLKTCFTINPETTPCLTNNLIKLLVA